MSEQVIERDELIRYARRLEYFTIFYNSLEGLFSIGAGLLAGSISLVGFGFDSLIELTSGAVILWRLGADHDTARREVVEKQSLKLIGICFVLLAGYILYDSISSLYYRREPQESILGIAIAIASLIVMPLLARAKRRLATQLSSQAIFADARQCEFCIYLSVILLTGLLLNALFGWWWADSVAAICMSPIILREGIEAIRGKKCNECNSHCH
ncbi:MAG: cation transporter [Acidobacteriota bacterium]|nr:cation transporter [Blastocatellia bacterium]MDW8413767.1 cation transporter [Acidobacteriota bacterium]